MTDTAPQTESPRVQIDIISDVMCPWCIVGFKQLEQALGITGVGAYIRWHPFELNPEMGPEGQNLAEHMAEKYGASAEQSAQNRAQLTAMGKELGFDFNFTADSKMVNTFAAHQLLDWAQEQGRQHPLKLALFKAHFSDQRDVSDPAVLTDLAADVGLDRAAAEEVLRSGSHAAQTRERQQFWTSRGISSAPSMVFGGRYLVSGAQGPQAYAQVIAKVLEETEESGAA